MQQPENDVELEKRRINFGKMIVGIIVGLAIAWFLTEVILPAPFGNLAF